MFLNSYILLFICAALHFSSASNHDYRSDFMFETTKQLLRNLDELPGVSEQCKIQVNYWRDLLMEGPIMANNWAWRMADASGKLNTGLLTGNLVGMGQMDECLAIDEVYNGVNIKGQYCYSGLFIPLGEAENKTVTRHNQMNRFRNMMATGLHPLDEEENANPLINYAVSICIPHECDWMEIIGLNELLEYSICQTKDTFSDYDGGDWAFIVFFIVIVILVLLSTCYDWYIRHNNKKPAHPVTLAFSFYTNSEKLLRITNNPDQLQSLNGIRAMSMLWVLTGHRFNVSTINTMVNMVQVVEWLQSAKSFYLISAPLAVDSFLFLSGVVLAYGFMKSQSKPKARFNIILYYVHRYLRLTPAVGVMFFIYVTIYKHISSGPLWPLFTNTEQENCLNNAMSYFLYIQNIINPNNQCLSHTWYLSVDMQLFVISPLILLPMVKFAKYAGYGLVGLILLSILPPTLITYFMDIVNTSEDYFKHYYSQPYNRISPWLVGLLLGYLFYQLRDRKIKIHWLINLCIWTVILIGMFFIAYVAPEMMASKDITAFAVYSGFHRLCWALGLMWIVFACQNGYGGIVNWFLSLPIFQILARLSYSMYLLHVLVELMAALRKRTPYFFDDYDMLNQAFGDTIVVTFLAFFYCMMFESPMIIIQKLLLGPNSYIIKLLGLGDKKESNDKTIDSLPDVTCVNATNGHADKHIEDSKVAVSDE